MYEVSTEGRLRRRDGRVLKGGRRSDGKVNVRLWRHGESQRFLLHRLVAHAFLGPCPEGQEVCHNDGNASNSRLSNLRYDTHASNLLDKHDHGTHIYAPNAKITEEVASMIRNVHTPRHKNFGQAALARRFGISSSQVRRVLRGECWGVVPS